MIDKSKDLIVGALIPAGVYDDDNTPAKTKMNALLAAAKGIGMIAAS